MSQADANAVRKTHDWFGFVCKTCGTTADRSESNQPCAGGLKSKSRETLSVLTLDHRLNIPDPIDFYPTAEHWGWTRWNLPTENQG